MSTQPGPAVPWLAARTGRDPAELTSSPVSALRAALVELATVAAQAELGAPEAREAACAELADLREQIASAPPPSDAFLTTVAIALRDAAARLRTD